MKLKASNTVLFQSTPPAREATQPYFKHSPTFTISIHASREGGDAPAFKINLAKVISIHASREGGD